jgi:hypothetical protein
MAYRPAQTEPPGELLAEVRKEVEAGLYSSTKTALDDYQRQLDYLNAQNFAHLERREGEEHRDFRKRPKQFSHITRKAVRALARLYAPGPERKLAPPETEGETPSVAHDFLVELVYRKQHINAVLQRVDQLATLHGVCAVQPVPTNDPDDPIRLDLWGRNEFVPFFADEDYRKPKVVVTRSVQERGPKCRRLYRIWDEKAVQTYTTEWVDRERFGVEYWRGTAATLVQAESGSHPYGVLPFAFFFNSMPVDSFDGSGIGQALAHANSEMDRMLSDTAEILQTFLAPKMYGVNLAESFRWRDRVDGIIPLPWRVSPDDGGMVPEIRFAQPTLDMEQSWLHLEKYGNQVFEDLDVPIKAVRGESHWEASGIAIVVSMAPLLQYLRDRQTPFAAYEQDLARVTLTVAGRWYGSPELEAAASDELTLSWPPVSIPVPSQEVDSMFQSGLTMGIESPVTILMKRDGLTRELAERRLEEIAEDNAEYGGQRDGQGMQQGEGQEQGQGRQGKVSPPDGPAGEPEGEGEESE